MKVSAARKTFMRFNSRDKDGHLPMLYEVDYAKMNKIRWNILGSYFKNVNTKQNRMFGCSRETERK